MQILTFYSDSSFGENVLLLVVKESFNGAAVICLQSDWALLDVLPVRALSCFEVCDLSRGVVDDEVTLELWNFVTFNLYSCPSLFFLDNQFV